ncbi:hypothetical protein Angca_008943, partial [Angiostrongylus cantonensis]
SVGEPRVRIWLEEFRSGDLNIEGNEGRGRPNELDDDELKPLVKANTRTTGRELTEQLGVSTGTISTQLNGIGNTKERRKWEPHKLNCNKKKNRRNEVSSALILHNKNDPFSERIVACEEKLILSTASEIQLNG